MERSGAVCGRCACCGGAEGLAVICGCGGHLYHAACAREEERCPVEEFWAVAEELLRELSSLGRELGGASGE